MLTRKHTDIYKQLRKIEFNLPFHRSLNIFEELHADISK